MSAKKKSAPSSVFDAAVTCNFQSIDPVFMQHIRRMVHYRRAEGRLPGPHYRSQDGLDTGAWLVRCQHNPHVLTPEQRAILLSVPGVRLSLDPGLSRLPMGHRGETESKLWSRVAAWSDNEVYDPGTRRARHNAMKLRMANAAA